MTMLSPAGIPTGSFSTSASRSAAQGSLPLSSTGFENDLSTRIVPELGLLPEVENPTEREYNFPRSRTHQVAVSQERDSLNWPVKNGLQELI
jgi:hypothetical protein